MPAKETKAGKLIRLFGGVTKLAHAIGRDKAIPSRWDSSGPKGNNGEVPPHHNKAIIAAARIVPYEQIPDEFKGKRRAFIDAVKSCLNEHVCPTCHRELPAGTVIDKRLAK